MAALITAAQYQTRYGTVSDTDKLEAHIDDVSAEVVDYVATMDNDTDNPVGQAAWGIESGDTAPPQAIVGVVARVVNRAMSNPTGATQEGLGDHNWSFALGGAGGMLSPKDRKIIRRAIGKNGVGTVYLEGYNTLPAEYATELS